MKSNIFKMLFSTLLPVVAYVNESKSIRLQLFLVLKMNFKRDMPIKEKKSIQSKNCLNLWSISIGNVFNRM